MTERHEKKFVEQFAAVGSDGRAYTVKEYRVYIHATMLDNSSQSLEGSRYFRLSDGSSVNMHGENEFEIVATGVKLRRQ